MPREAIEYSKTHFYKIVCKDLTITECYVGHTTNFYAREKAHKHNSNSEQTRAYNTYVYEYIRANGGWSNWQMVQIECRSCVDGLEARRIEREHMEKLKASLNRMKSYQTPEESKSYHTIHYRENKETINEKHRKHYEQNKEKTTKKHKEYYEQNKEKLAERAKEYREQNKEQLSEKSKERYQRCRQAKCEKFGCVCGGSYTYQNRHKHFRTTIHQSYLDACSMTDDGREYVRSDIVKF